MQTGEITESYHTAGEKLVGNEVAIEAGGGKKRRREEKRGMEGGREEGWEEERE